MNLQALQLSISLGTLIAVLGIAFKSGRVMQKFETVVKDVEELKETVPNHGERLTRLESVAHAGKK